MTDTSVKQPLPYSGMSGSFKSAGNIRAGKLVTISAAGTVSLTGTGTEDYIGIAEYNHAHVAAQETDVFASGDVVSVRFRGPVFKVIMETGLSGSDAPVGTYITQGSSGKFTPETGTKTINSIGILLTAGGTDDQVEAVMF